MLRIRLLWREWFEVEEAWFLSGVFLEINAGDLIEEGAVLELGETMFLGAGATVGIIAGVDLGDEDGASGIDGQAEEKRTESVDGFDETVSFGVVDEEVFVGDARVFDDVDDVPEGEDVVVGDGVLMGIEGDEVAIDFVATGELGFVVRFEGKDVELPVFNRNGAGVLRGDGEVFGDLAGGDIDYGNFVFRGERDVGFLIVGESDADGLVESGGTFFWIEILNGGDDMKAGRTCRVGIDNTHGIRDMVAHPDFLAIGTDGNTDGVDANGDAFDEAAVFGVDDIDGVGGSVGDEEGVLEKDDGLEVWAEKGGVADGGGFWRAKGWGGLFVARRKEPDPGERNGGEEKTKGETLHGRRVLFSGDSLDGFLRKIRVLEPLPGRFRILSYENASGLDKGRGAGFRVLDRRGPIDGGGGIVVDHAGGVTIGGGVFVG